MYADVRSLTSVQFPVTLSQSLTLIATGLVLSQGDSTTSSLLNRLVPEVKRGHGGAQKEGKA